MDEAIRRLLGIRKKTSWLYDLWYSIRKQFSVKLLIVSIMLVSFIAAILFFANNEVMKRPDLLATFGPDTNPYFLSVYWLVTTVATVGYGDITPITAPGIMVALVVMMLGVVTVSFVISQLTSKIVAMNLGSMFGVTKTKRKIDCIICGWNPISESAFHEIKKPGVEIVVIDKLNRPELAKARDIHFIAGDATNPDILRRANITNAKSIILAMEEDSEVLLAIHVIRELNPWINIVAKINNHEHVKIAESAGADQVVSPPSIGGRLLSMVSDEQSVVEWVIRATSSAKGTQLVEYDVLKDSPFANKTVREARKSLGSKAKIIGIDTAEGFEKIPGDEMKIEAGNKLIMMVDTKRFRL